MSGTRGRSGGARKGAGRKPLPPEQFANGTYVTETKKNKAYQNIEEKIDNVQTCEMKELSMPTEFEFLPNARKAWLDCLELDKASKYHLLNDRHKECLKSFCLAVELRQRLLEEYANTEKQVLLITKTGEMKISPIVSEITKLNDKINNYADALGLTVLSEFKMAVEAKKGNRLNGAEEEKGEDSLFD